MTGIQIFIAVLIAIELPLLVLSLKRAKLLLIPNGALILILYYQSIFFLVHEGYVENAVLANYALGGLQTYFYQAEYFYAFVFLLIALTSWDIRSPERAATVTAARSALNDERLSSINHVGAPFCAIHFIIYCLGVKWSLIWYNETYLAMIDPSQVSTGGALSSIAISLLVPVGVAAACLSAINLGRGNFLYGLLYTAFWSFAALLQFAAHQRGATLIAGMFLLAYFALAEKRSWLLMTVVAGFALLSYPTALAGRVLPQQGLGSIAPTIAMLFQLDSGDFINLALTNVGEGIFTFAESLVAPVSYPTLYKILSFSPLPSAIDGFAAIREIYQIRLAVVVPLSGYAEAMKFGNGYAALLALYFICAIRLNRAIAEKNQLAFLLVNTFIFLAFFMLGAYPLRSGLRLLVVAIGVALAVQIFDSMRRRRMASSKP